MIDKVGGHQGHEAGLCSFRQSHLAQTILNVFSVSFVGPGKLLEERDRQVCLTFTRQGQFTARILHLSCPGIGRGQQRVREEILDRRLVDTLMASS